MKAASHSGSQPLVDFGNYALNYYFNPFNSIAVEQYIRYDVTGNPPLSNYIGIDDRVIPWSLNGWRTMAQHGDPTGVGHPLRLPGYRLDPGTPPVAVGFHTDECAAVFPWNATAGPFTGNGADGSYLSFANQDYLERWGAGLGSLTPIVTGSAISPPGTYRFQMRMRSANTDALQLGPIYDTQTNKMPLPHAHFALTPGWSEEDLILEIPEGYDMVTAFQNVQRAYGVISASDVDIDYVRVDRIALDPTYTEEIAANHILRYHADLPGTEGDPQNVASAGGNFTVPGTTGQCWSDVHGNFYAAGDGIELDEWTSIILFRFDPPPTEGAANVITQITGETTWTEHKNYLGRISVASGATLTIDGAHIGFPESAPSFASNITVEPGGTLDLKNGGTLRSWMGCDGPSALWDGVKVLGTGTTTGAGMIILESGGRISQAHTAIRTDDGSPTNPLVPGTATSSGGIVQASNAVFENNAYDVAFLPHGDIDPIDYGPSFFTNTVFVRSAPLLSSQNGGVHVSLLNSAATEFIGCTWANTTGANPTTPSGWGMGVQAIETRIRIADSEDGTVRSKISGLNSGVLHSSYTPGTTADIDGCDFSGNARGALLYGSSGSRIVNSTFQVPDLPVNDLEVAAAYGSYLYGCTGFEVEENAYAGIGGTDHPKVGAIFRSTGTDYNQFSRNSFNGFNGAGVSAGSIIMGNNGGGSPNDGLHWRCNQFSNVSSNDHDVAFTADAVGVTIGQFQGTNDFATTLASNTYANYDDACGDGTNDNPERHLYVHPDAQAGLNVFEYWHHQDVPTTEYRPHCDSDPIVVDVDIALDWIKESSHQYTSMACPLDLSRDQDITDVLTELGDVAAEHKELAEVYGDWSDGGNTTGLKDFILDPANSSVAVRNRLMLMAPKVSHENWERAFFRSPAMDPWHLAQALVANSPLPLQTMLLLDSSLVNPYYKQLVLNSQNGTSMHSIYQGELSYLYGRASNAAYTAVDLVRRDAARIDDALAILDATDLTNKEHLALALWLAKGDVSTAYALIDSMRTALPHDGFWAVQGLLMDLALGSKTPMEIEGPGIATLQQIAQDEREGCGQARAWLLMLNDAFTEPIVLPTKQKRARVHSQVAEEYVWHPLTVFPNPSKGPVSIVYEVPDAVADARVRVMDALGKLVHEQRVSGKGIVELDLPKPSTGLHIVGLYFDGQLIGTEKVQII